MSANESKEIVNAVVREVSKIVSEMAGIQLGDRQSSMVENRLRSRMVRMNLHSFTDYLHHLKTNKESESQALLSLMTTHHTYFFREFNHFEFLLTIGLKRLVELARRRGDKTIRLWSAACSKGQEVYSLAMFLNYHMPQIAPDIKFEIWGTDVDPESVKHAKNGVYLAEELKQAPSIYTTNNWIRGKGNVSEFSKVKENLRVFTKFGTANLLNCSEFLKDKNFDIIFCRNVFIYFNQDQIKQITQNFLKHLSPEGFLFLGVSESLNGLGMNVDMLGASIYQHKQIKKIKSSSSSLSASSEAQSANSVSPVLSIEKMEPQRTMNVLAIDDSPTILSLLKKIMTTDTGFQIAATAKNGKEALDILAKQKFDFITLDLHMPELDGLGFLKAYTDRQTPILIVSSVNRDNADEAQKAISLGASDYVEKPSLENIAQAGNEIRSKMKTVLQARHLANSMSGAASSSQVAVAETMSAAETAAQKARSLIGKNVDTKTSVSASSVAKASLSKKIKVLIVDDSKTIRNLLTQILKQDPAFEIVGEAERPSQVEDLIKKNRPDVITLDIHMPEMDGVTLLKRIHPLYKIPTVMISSISREEGPEVLTALEVGAVDYIQKPQMSEMTEASNMIRERLKIAAQAKVIVKTSPAKKLVGAAANFDNHNLIVMGASTGGTEALRVVLETMPAKVPPILIVQHIPPVFSAAFANRLNELCAFEVREAKNGDEVKAGLALVAPGGKQMSLKKTGEKLFVEINEDAPVNRHKPSVDYMFKTVAEKNIKKVVAVILTGMGGDGAVQMKALRDKGARTIAQNEQTCVVYGMPKEAVAKGGAEFVLPLEQIAEKVLNLSSEGFSESTQAKKPA